MSIKIQGIGASNGISIAKALILENIKPVVTRTSIKNVKEEIEKLLKIKDQAVAQLDIIIKKAANKLTSEELQVFEAHKQIASDPFLIDLITKEIEINKMNLGYAIQKIYSKQEEMFLDMNDAYMAERAVDVRDVASRLLNNYYGIKNVDLSAIDHEIILVAHDLTPSETSQLDKNFTKGFITSIGGRTSHSAIMARSMEIPAILGLKENTKKIKIDDLIIIDGAQGIVIVNPTKEELKEYSILLDKQQAETKDLKSFIGKKTISLDKHEVVLAANIGTTHDIESALKNDAQEIGLFRSEFLYMNQEEWPNEEIQYNAYRQVLESMENKRVVVRTLDIGGDKKLKYYTFPEEMNPFLGYRAIRLCLDRKDIFRTQLRALLRASKYGKLAIMFPMIAIVEEFVEAKKFLEEVKTELIKEGGKVGSYEVGMMVEIPAAALNIESFCKYSDFFSIGTNDLIQYSMAADRMSEKVSYLYRPLNPSILKLIYKIILDAHKHKKPVGMCGELAGDPQAIPILLGMGLDEFSMSSSAILNARKIISKINKSEIEKKLPQILARESESEVIDFINKYLKIAKS